MEEKKPKARREYKDTVFRMLFSDEKNLLSLYNAVTGRSYEDAKELEIVTLDNAVYMGMKNDLAFLLDLHISLYEHQSTKNPNMPQPQKQRWDDSQRPDADGDRDIFQRSGG